MARWCINNVFVTVFCNVKFGFLCVVLLDMGRNGTKGWVGI